MTHNYQTHQTRPLSLLVREKTRSYITQFPYEIGTECPNESLPHAREAEFDPTGDTFVAIEGPDQVAVIRSAVTADEISRCGGLQDPHTPLKINFATFSPLGTYLLTWSRPVDGISVPNLVIYLSKTGEKLAGFYQKVFHIGLWPSIQWSDDESIAGRCVTNTIHFFKGDSLCEPPSAKLGIPGVSKFALSHGCAPYTIAAFIGGTKGAPGRIGTFKHPDEGGEQIGSRSTFRADSVTFKWNAKGTALLCLISTNIDTSGKSYYGESEVYFMDNLGVVDQRVDLPNEGPTYDAAWSPTGSEFIIIYGYMPARATMFNVKCEPVFDFGTGARNTISFSPHGRFVALAGFGNLAGAVEFWDKNKMSVVGRAQLPCTTMFSWSPCSRYFLGATTFPRLRVDNCLRVVRFDGQVIHEHKVGDGHLYQAVFRPALRNVYGDPKLSMEDMIGGPVVAVSRKNGENGEVNKKGGVYRPPGSRGTAVSDKLHQHIEAGRVDKSKFMQSGNVSNANHGIGHGLGGRKKIVPGMDPEVLNAGPSKAALARKKKKEREKQMKSKKKECGEGDSIGSSSGGRKTDVEASVEASVEACVDEIDNAEDAKKRVRKLRKKVRAIETLEMNKQEGKELNQEQLDKLATMGSVKEELERMEKRVTELSG